jgi:hypothetical protein
VHDNPEPTEEEHEQAVTERLQEEEAMRYPGHDDPEAAQEQDDDE